MSARIIVSKEAQAFIYKHHKEMTAFEMAAYTKYHNGVIIRFMVENKIERLTRSTNKHKPPEETPEGMFKFDNHSNWPFW